MPCNAVPVAIGKLGKLIDPVRHFDIGIAAQLAERRSRFNCCWIALNSDPRFVSNFDPFLNAISGL